MNKDKLNLTEDKVILFFHKMCKHFDAHVINKHDALEMKGLALAIDAITPIDRDDFMERWSTTLWDKVYVPFRVGEVDNDNYPLVRQVTTLIHELTHKLQFDADKMMPIIYILSDADRAVVYEGEAQSANIEFNFKRFGISYVPNYNNYAKKLLNYRCDKEDGEAVKGKLKSDYMMYIQPNFPTVSKVVEKAIEILKELDAWNG